MGRKGLSLIEIMVAVSVVLLAAGVCMPLMRGWIERKQFHRAQAQLQAHLVMARMVAQQLETSVRFTTEDAGVAYRIRYEQGDDWQELAVAEPFPKGIGVHLPNFNLPHPSRKGAISQALSSTHAPDIVFTARGGSSATLCLSGPQGQVFCAVVASQTGRLRCYLWEDDHWRAVL